VGGIELQCTLPGSSLVY